MDFLKYVCLVFFLAIVAGFAFTFFAEPYWWR